MFFDEEMLLDIRLDIMSKYVDKFVITEATYMHSGKPKKLQFDIKKYSKFKDKIIYNVVDKIPQNLEKINEEDNQIVRGNKLINNSVKRENLQREFVQNSLDAANDEDIILINDIDEIPNLNNVNFNNIKNKIIIFQQNIFYYKFNLLYKNFIWHGSKACRKKYFISPQWLRNVKHKKYAPWRLDVFFSKKKHSNIHYVKNGGWHFTNIKTAEDLEKKFNNFLHHQDYEASGLNLKNIQEMIKNKKILYDLDIDQRGYKWSGEKTLVKVPFSQLPDYISKNYMQYNEWLDL
jgi:beta-1,4-mannosyl-glycoprotein beta-1,4-N-acetylglucosaminyltransferase